MIGDRLYAAGGATGAGTTFKRLEVFDFSTRRWSRGPDMAVPREHIAGAVSGGRFYVVGGRPGNLAVAERYDPARRRWERLPDLRTARSGIAAATVGRHVVVFGGERGDGTIRPVEAFDPRTRRWRALPGMRTPRHGLGGVSLRQARLLARRRPPARPVLLPHPRGAGPLAVVPEHAVPG